MNTLEEVIETYGANWESDADAVHDLLHPVEEAYQAEKQYQCQNCINGMVSNYPYNNHSVTCHCCNGNWQDCQNCRPEGTGNDTEDLLASMR